MKIDTGTPDTFTPTLQVTDGSGFAKHGITHLSASSLNLWTNAPDVWVAGYLLKKRTAFGAAPKRGIVVEDAVAAMLAGTARDKAIAAAVAKFNKSFPGEDLATSKERDMIEPMTDLAFAELEQYGKPDFTEDGQHKIVLNCKFDGWSIPLWGFLDFVWPEQGLVIDLKTTGRMPSVMSAEHQLQRAIYAKAKGNSAVKFLYVTPKKAELKEDGDVAACLNRAKAHIARLDTFLRHCPDAEAAREIVPVSPGSFYWRGSEDLLHEIYGF